MHPIKNQLKSTRLFLYDHPDYSLQGLYDHSEKTNLPNGKNEGSCSNRGHDYHSGTAHLNVF